MIGLIIGFARGFCEGFRKEFLDDEPEQKQHPGANSNKEAAPKERPGAEHIEEGGRL